MQQIKIIVCGDFRAAYPERIVFSKEVDALLADVDLRICNFEAPVHVDGAKPIKKSGPSLDQSIHSPSFLKNKGFNAILLANNHIMDYGEEGLCATLESFKDVITVGAGTAKEAFAVRYLEIKGYRIGLMSLVQHEFGVVESVDDEQYGAAWVCSPDVPQIIMGAKKQCDFLLVMPHAGVEHTIAPLPEWRRLYKRLIEWGADAVVVSHPHCPQGIEFYREKPIYYSLGNFYFDELTDDKWWYKSICVEFQLGKDKSIQIKNHYIFFDDSGRVSVETNNDMSERMLTANQFLVNEKKYSEYIEKICDIRYKSLSYGMLRGLCGMSFRLKPQYVLRLIACMLLRNSNEPFLLNAICSESDRWVLKRALHNRICKKQ